MSEFVEALRSAKRFLGRLPDAGTMMRPSVDRFHVLAARDGVLTATVIRAIVAALATSGDAEQFVAATGGAVSDDEADELYALPCTAEAAEDFTRRLIRRHGSADTFVTKALRLEAK